MNSNADTPSLGLFEPDWQFTMTAHSPRESVPDWILVPATQPSLAEEMAGLLGEQRVRTFTEAPLDLPPGDHYAIIVRSPWAQGAQTSVTVAVLNLLKTLSRLQRARIDVVACRALAGPPGQDVRYPLDATCLGLAQTASREYPHLSINAFSLCDFAVATLHRAFSHRPTHAPATPVHITQDGYAVRHFKRASLNSSVSGLALRKGGHYLVLGGTGGLGRMLASYLVERHQARVHLVSRSAPDFELHELMRHSSCDISVPQALEAIFEAHGPFDAVIHSAMDLHDQTLDTLQPAQLERNLRPKLLGSYGLIQALRQHPVDFVLFFSSIQSHLANPGQGAYTAACAVKDAMAALLEETFQIPSKIINWGYWGSVGAVAAPYYRERMEKVGVGSLEAEDGIATIEALISSDQRQVMALKANAQALLAMGFETADSPGVVPVDELQSLIPPFDDQAEWVRRNEQASVALDEYARRAIHRIGIPTNIAAHHQALAQALSAIEDAPQALDRHSLLQRFAHLRAHLDLLDACMADFASILQGKTDPLEVLFPHGSFDRVEGVYRNNSVADYYNQTMATIVERLADSTEQPLRVLEIGAGTGSTTEQVMARVGHRLGQYRFTDLSLSFINRARRTFDQPCFEASIYNVEQPPQWLGAFDIVLATNVIHATRDIRESLRNIRRALRPGGVIVLNEVTALQHYATLTFGLTKGWWLNTGPERIEGSPLLDAATWQRLLRETGFENTEHHGNQTQGLIVARVPVSATAGAPAERAPAASASQTSGAAAANIDEVRLSSAMAFARDAIASVMHLTPSDLDPTRALKDYGIDSLIALELVKPFKDKVGYVPATLFFEYPTLADLAGYLEQCHPEAFKVADSSAPATAAQPGGESDTLHFVRESIAKVMHMSLDELDDDAAFASYGIDSLISLELIKPLQARYGYLPATLLFEYPSIAQLAGHLGQHATSAQAKVTAAGHAHATTGQGPQPADLRTDQPAQAQAIAIIGYRGRFPGAEDTAQLWERLLQDVPLSSPVPPARWPREHMQTSTYAGVGAFLSDVDRFDHGFFNITPMDATLMDPQERLFLETAYQTFLHGAHPASRLKGSRTGVYVGVMNTGYANLTPIDSDGPRPTSLHWSIANRVSYHFDLHGPSMAVDTACSASLTALHTAVNALRLGDCDMALVGGVNVIAHPRQYDDLCRLHMLSLEGVCRPFGEGADGFVDGEGVCAMLLKPLDRALADEDPLYGVIEASALNAGGKSNGYSAPNPQAQSRLIREALDKAKWAPTQLDYVEAHGTGTALGDPIEFKSLAAVLGEGRTETSRLPIGSIKGHIGHLESAAGLAGAVKILLQMRHRTLLPSLHAHPANPLLEPQTTGLMVNRHARPWPARDNQPYRAALSSFGAGGANAHVLLSSGIQTSRPARHPTSARQLIMLSAHSVQALDASRIALLQWLEQNDVPLPRLASSLAHQRDHLRHRLAVCSDSTQDLRRQLALSLVDLRGNGESTAVAGCDANAMNSMRMPGQQQDMDLDSVRLAYLGGALPDWHALFAADEPLELPEYCFDGTPLWVQARESGFESLDTLLADHNIDGQAIVPAGYYLARLLADTSTAGLMDVRFEARAQSFECVGTEQTADRFAVTIANTTVASASTLEQHSHDQQQPWTLDSGHYLQRTAIYQKFARMGYCYGDSLRLLRWACVGDNKVQASVLPARSFALPLSPAIIDAGLQTALLLDDGEAGPAWVPWMAEKVERLSTHAAIAYVCCQRREKTARSVTHDFEFLAQDMSPVLRIQGLVSLHPTHDVARGQKPAARPKVVLHEL